MAIIDLKHCTLTIKGASGGSQEDVVIKLGEGTLTSNTQRNMEYRLDGGSLDNIREGDEVPMEVSFEGIWETLHTSGASGQGSAYSILQALKAEGNSTDTADPCRPASCDLELVFDNLNCASDQDQTITYPYFRYESFQMDANAGTISVSGKCNVVEPTFDPASPNP